MAHAVKVTLSSHKAVLKATVTLHPYSTIRTCSEVIQPQSMHIAHCIRRCMTVTFRHVAVYSEGDIDNVRWIRQCYTHTHTHVDTYRRLHTHNTHLVCQCRDGLSQLLELAQLIVNVGRHTDIQLALHHLDRDLYEVISGELHTYRHTHTPCTSTQGHTYHTLHDITDVL